MFLEMPLFLSAIRFRASYTFYNSLEKKICFADNMFEISPSNMFLSDFLRKLDSLEKSLKNEN